MSIFKVICQFLAWLQRTIRRIVWARLLLWKKINPWLKGIKCLVFVFWPFLLISSRICSICMIELGNGAHCLSQTAFLKRIWITNYRGLSVKEWCLGGFSLKWCYGGFILACLFFIPGLPNRSLVIAHANPSVRQSNTVFLKNHYKDCSEIPKI